MNILCFSIMPTSTLLVCCNSGLGSVQLQLNHALVVDKLPNIYFCKIINLPPCVLVITPQKLHIGLEIIFFLANYSWRLQLIVRRPNPIQINTHTYIICHYNPSVRIIDLVDSERQIFWEIFHGSFNLLAEFLPEIC